MLTPQAEALLDQMQTMIDQSHALQLEMLEMLRVALQSETRAERPVTGDATGPAPEVALIARDLPDKPTFSVEEVGQILGVGRATAYRAVQLGQIPALRLGRRLLIPRTALLSMMSARR